MQTVVQHLMTYRILPCDVGAFLAAGGAAGSTRILRIFRKLDTGLWP
jgi:hypothetical protein